MCNLLACYWGGEGGVNPPSLTLQRSVCNPSKDELEKSVQIFLASLDHLHAFSVELLFVFRVKICCCCFCFFVCLDRMNE